MFRLTAVQAANQVLWLEFSPAPDPQHDLLLLKQWLNIVLPASQCQTEQHLDLCQVRFYHAGQPFMLSLEHYSASCWIEAGSADAFLLMSDLALLLAHNISYDSST